MLNLPIKYGGAMVGQDEIKALGESIGKSVVTGNWQQAEEGALMEQEAARFLGLQYGVLTNSGSSAGLLALSALELPKGSEVIIPATTFPTIFNIILQCGLKPVVVDCEVGTYNLNVNQLADLIGEKTKAIIAVHAVGNPCDMTEIVRLAKLYDLKVIEDNCDGWGSTINGQKVGSFGNVSFTSFHAAHIVSMGVGGGVFTNSPEIAQNVRMYRDWGRQANTTEPHKVKTLPTDYNPRFVYDKIGYNFQILELQAAMGRVQLRKADEIKKLRQDNVRYLIEHLSKFPDLIMPKTVKGAEVCWFSFPITTKGDRGKLVNYLENKQIETRSMFAGNILKHPAYQNMRFKKLKLSGADYILEHSFWISCHPRLSQEDREYIVKCFEDYYASAT